MLNEKWADYFYDTLSKKIQKNVAHLSSLNQIKI